MISDEFSDCAHRVREWLNMDNSPYETCDNNTLALIDAALKAIDSARDALDTQPK